jgi:hypothetical protein
MNTYTAEVSHKGGVCPIKAIQCQEDCVPCSGCQIYQDWINGEVEKKEN